MCVLLLNSLNSHSHPPFYFPFILSTLSRYTVRIPGISDILISFLFLLYSFTTFHYYTYTTMTTSIPPSQTLYINHLLDKVHKEGIYYYYYNYILLSLLSLYTIINHPSNNINNINRTTESPVLSILAVWSDTRCSRFKNS